MKATQLDRELFSKCRIIAAVASTGFVGVNERENAGNWPARNHGHHHQRPNPNLQKQSILLFSRCEGVQDVIADFREELKATG